MTAPVEHSALGRIDVIRNAVTMTGATNAVRSPTPESGQHTDEILRELGLAAHEIEDLRRRGIV